MSLPRGPVPTADERPVISVEEAGRYLGLSRPGAYAAVHRGEIPTIRTGRLQDVVRTRIFVTDISRWREVVQVHGEVFGDIRPVTSMLKASALVDPRFSLKSRPMPSSRRPTVSGTALPLARTGKTPGHPVVASSERLVRSFSMQGAERDARGCPLATPRCPYSWIGAVKSTSSHFCPS
jgi:excisionase family DNA binding protein